MTFTHPSSPAVENQATQSRSTRVGEVDGPTGPNPLERLVQIMQGNERLMTELQASGRRLGQARAYLAEPGCNRSLGRAQFDHCRAKYAGILAQLRANRLEALRLLNATERGARA